MLHAWPNTSGDYTGSQITNNRIDCSNYRCGFGLLIGPTPWYDAKTFGGTYESNTVIGAQVGIAINDISGPITMGSKNTASSSSGRFLSSAGARSTYPYTMSSASQNRINWANPALAGAFSLVDYRGAILNWWTSDWIGTSYGPLAPVVTPTPPPASVNPAPTPELSNPNRDYVIAAYRRYLERASVIQSFLVSPEGRASNGY